MDILNKGLIERLEAATGPDRELDLLIHEAFGKCAHRKLHREECDNDGYDLVCSSCGTDSTHIEERYTASLDDAMTLVDLEVGTKGQGHAFFPYVDRVTHDLGRTFQWVAWLRRTPDRWTAEAATPALALCIVALKALPTQPGDK